MGVSPGLGSSKRPAQVQNGVQIPRRILTKPRRVLKQTTKFTAKRNLVHVQITVECLLSAMRMTRHSNRIVSIGTIYSEILARTWNQFPRNWSFGKEWKPNYILLQPGTTRRHLLWLFPSIESYIWLESTYFAIGKPRFSQTRCSESLDETSALITILIVSLYTFDTETSSPSPLLSVLMFHRVTQNILFG